MKKNLLIEGIIVALVFTFMSAYFAWAQEGANLAKDLSAKEKAVNESKEESVFEVEVVSGEVSGIGKNYISVLYDRDYDTGTEYEIMIPVDSKTTMKHKNKLLDIKKGDLVSVEYEKPVSGPSREMKARAINFIQSGTGSLVADTVNSAIGESI